VLATLARNKAQQPKRSNKAQQLNHYRSFSSHVLCTIDAVLLLNDFELFVCHLELVTHALVILDFVNFVNLTVAK